MKEIEDEVAFREMCEALRMTECSRLCSKEKPTSAELIAWMTNLHHRAGTAAFSEGCLRRLLHVVPMRNHLRMIYQMLRKIIGPRRKRLLNEKEIREVKSELAKHFLRWPKLSLKNVEKEFNRNRFNHLL